MKIDAQEPLKSRNLLRKLCIHVPSSRIPTTAFSLTTEHTTEHVYIICQSEFLHFRGSCAPIFVIFFLNGLKFHVESKFQY